MGRKTYNTDAKRECFNKTPYGDSQKIRKLLLESLNEVAEKYEATPINLRDKSDYPSDFRDREWAWRPQFFQYYLDMVESTHNKWPERVWLDNLIRQCGHMVWNLAHSTIVLEYQNGGTWPGAENLPRKQRGPEAVAENFANKEKEAFLLKFE